MFAYIMEFFYSPALSNPQVSYRARWDDEIVWLEGEGVVDREIYYYQKGRVSYGGSYWDAKCEDDLRLLPGQFIKVVARKNTTLIVEPIASKLPSA